MFTDLDTLEIHILLKCSEGLLKRSRLSSLYARYPLEKRKQSINHLIMAGYLIDKELPLPEAKVAPVYYEITNKGKIWVKEYLEEHPARKKKT